MSSFPFLEFFHVINVKIQVKVPLIVTRMLKLSSAFDPEEAGIFGVLI